MRLSFPLFISLLLLLSWPGAALPQRKNSKATQKSAPHKNSEPAPVELELNSTLTEAINKLASSERLNVVFDTQITKTLDDIKLNTKFTGVSPLNLVLSLISSSVLV